ncbi:hypothetical protein Acsp05_23420 [Actinokineospora sp. NBRC 105648]|nr:hypothetical protein Acsp05_23420 [Actinokineospora sp. NBRC 105648]
MQHPAGTDCPVEQPRVDLGATRAETGQDLLEHGAHPAGKGDRPRRLLQNGVVSAPTQTLPELDTRPEGTETTGDDTPKMFHYVRKNKIAESAVMGNMVVALCGEVFPVTKSPKPGSPVCPDCKKIYESMKD